MPNIHVCEIFLYNFKNYKKVILKISSCVELLEFENKTFTSCHPELMRLAT